MKRLLAGFFKRFIRTFADRMGVFNKKNEKFLVWIFILITYASCTVNQDDISSAPSLQRPTARDVSDVNKQNAVSPYARDGVSNSHTVGLLTLGETSINIGHGGFINNKVILTAAHIFDEVPISSLVLGLAYLSTSTKTMKRVSDVKIKEIILHPDYPASPLVLYHDFALIVLEEPLLDMDTLKIPTREQVVNIPYGAILNFTHIGSFFNNIKPSYLAEFYEIGAPRVLLQPPSHLSPFLSLPFNLYDAFISIPSNDEPKKHIQGGDSGGSWYYYIDGHPYSVGVVGSPDIFKLPSEPVVIDWMNDNFARLGINKKIEGGSITNGIVRMDAISSTTGYTYYYDVVKGTNRIESFLNSPERVFDGNESTFWEPKEIGTDQWLLVELDKPRILKSYAMARSGTNNSRFPYKWKLLGSHDKEHWEKVHEYKGRYYYPTWSGDPKIAQFYLKPELVTFEVIKPFRNNSITVFPPRPIAYKYYKLSFDTEFASRLYWIHNVRIGMLDFTWI